jgi:hypothetical protein
MKNKRLYVGGAMGRRSRGIWRLAVVILLIGAAGLIGYRLGFEDSRKETGLLKKPVLPQGPPSQEMQGPPPEAPQPGEEKSRAVEEPAQPFSPPQLTCEELEQEIRDFCSYLDTKSYVRHLEPGKDSYACLQLLIKKLSSDPPIPAGEGIDPQILLSNIYYFFRHIDRNDLRLVREILVQEGDTLEPNLDLFYHWLMAGGKCPDPTAVRPPLKVLYQYAGFFLNTVGGRAYLFRRSPELRLLVSYYSVLIVHEADKKKMNSYGIDLYPMLAPMLQEIRSYPDFHFQESYIENLTRIQEYYSKR